MFQCKFIISDYFVYVRDLIVGTRFVISVLFVYIELNRHALAKPVM